ncbi:MAG TPA: DNA primase DnaG [Candidatus Nanoarchaeia archaeon]|nr:DNA primase DnaG [Candidatus Nanoarchaeia archaeon]
MAKIAQVAAKYIINSNIQIDGVVDRPDVIGAVFGQTEGLLGADLELRELQRSGRIGRIEVNTEVRGGKTGGSIIIPSSLDKAETAIIGAALEVIQRIGPCNAKIKVQNIEDVRVSKRQFVLERAKELLKQLMDGVMPDSQELADEVAYSVRMMEVQEYGKDRLPAGPGIEESEEIILVEGRADVLNMLKHGFKNVIGMNGTSVPQTIIDVSKKKTMTAFVDGDRGGDLIIKELLAVTEVDFITKAPDGKEVEEITKKEMHKALRSRVAAEQFRAEGYHPPHEDRREEPRMSAPIPQRAPMGVRPMGPSSSGVNHSSAPPAPIRKRPLTDKEKETFKTMLEDLVGTKGAYVLDMNLNILGKVPVSELQSTIKSLRSGVHAVVLDGVVDKDLVDVAERARVAHLVCMDTKIKVHPRVNIVTGDAI